MAGAMAAPESVTPRAATTHGPSHRPPSPACAALASWPSRRWWLGNGQRLAQARIGQDKVVIHLEQGQLLVQAVFSLTCRGAVPSQRCHPLPGLLGSGSSRNRSPVTCWAVLATPRQSCMPDLLWWSVWWTWLCLPSHVSYDPPMASTSHTARHPHAPSVRCLRRQHTEEAAPCLRGLRTHTAPAASRSASP